MTGLLDDFVTLEAAARGFTAAWFGDDHQVRAQLADEIVLAQGEAAQTLDSPSAILTAMDDRVREFDRLNRVLGDFVCGVDIPGRPSDISTELIAYWENFCRLAAHFRQSWECLEGAEEVLIRIDKLIGDFNQVVREDHSDRLVAAEQVLEAELQALSYDAMFVVGICVQGLRAMRKLPDLLKDASIEFVRGLPGASELDETLNQAAAKLKSFAVLADGRAEGQTPAELNAPQAGSIIGGLVRFRRSWPEAWLEFDAEKAFEGYREELKQSGWGDAAAKLRAAEWGRVTLFAGINKESPQGLFGRIDAMTERLPPFFDIGR